MALEGISFDGFPSDVVEKALNHTIVRSQLCSDKQNRAPGQLDRPHLPAAGSPTPDLGATAPFGLPTEPARCSRAAWGDSGGVLLRQ